MLFLGADKEKGPLDREQNVHVLHILPLRIPQNPTSRSTQSLRKMTFTSTLGTDADRPSDPSGVHLLLGHLSGEKWQKQQKALQSENGEKYKGGV